MSDWSWEQTRHHCPKCGSLLLFADDPDSDTWVPTGIYRCPSCNFRDDQRHFEGMLEGGDWPEDDDFDDLDDDEDEDEDDYDEHSPEEG